MSKYRKIVGDKLVVGSCSDLLQNEIEFSSVSELRQFIDQHKSERNLMDFEEESLEVYQNYLQNINGRI